MERFVTIKTAGRGRRLTIALKGWHGMGYA
jgi:hypothetical protein